MSSKSDKYKWSDDFTWDYKDNEYFKEFSWNDLKEVEVKEDKEDLLDDSIKLNNKESYLCDDKEIIEVGYNEDCENKCNDSECEICNLDECNLDEDSSNIIDKENFNKDEYYDGIDDNLINSNHLLQILKDLDIKELQETVDIKDKSLKELCIQSMEHILKKLKEEGASDIEIGTEAKETILDATILEVKDHLLKIKTSFDIIILPIYKIVGIYTSFLSKVDLISSLNFDLLEDLECYENSLNKFLSSHIGEEYSIKTVARDEIFSKVQGEITFVGKGIVIIDKNRVLSISKIISLQKDIRTVN